MTKTMKMSRGGGKTLSYLRSCVLFFASAFVLLFAYGLRADPVVIEGDYEITENVVLTDDMSVNGTLTLTGAQVNLNGHTLSVKGLAGSSGAGSSNNLVENGSFEDSDIPGSKTWASSVAEGFRLEGWSTTVGVGLERGTTWKAGDAPDGTKVLYFQHGASENRRYASTTVVAPSSGPYKLSFKYAGRPGSSTYLNGVIHVDVNNVEMRSFTCSSTNTQTAAFEIMLQEGDNSLMFWHTTVGTNDRCSWIDAVSVTSVIPAVFDMPGEEGSLVIDVPDDETFSNANVALSGSLKLVKKGGGTFVSRKAQEYTGGTIVMEGTARPPDPPKQDDITYCGDKFKAFSTGDIRVSTNGTFDVRSNYAYYGQVKLDGGTFTSSGPYDMTDSTKGGSGVGGITADSRVVSSKNVVFETRTSTVPNLNGKTLTFDVTAGQFNIRNSAFANGKIVFDVGSGTNVELAVRTAIDMSTVDFHVVGHCKLSLVEGLSVHDYVMASTRTNLTLDSSKAIKVYGSFKPITTYFYAPTMQDGSALDFSEWPQDAGWPVFTRYTVGNRQLKFVNGTVTVKLDPARADIKTLAQTKVNGEYAGYLVKWGTGAGQLATKNDNTTFVLDSESSKRFRLTVDSTGLLLSPLPGLVIIVQ